jgi:hypothetical protein
VSWILWFDFSCRSRFSARFREACRLCRAGIFVAGHPEMDLVTLRRTAGVILIA